MTERELEARLRRHFLPLGEDAPSDRLVRLVDEIPSTDVPPWAWRPTAIGRSRRLTELLVAVALLAMLVTLLALIGGGGGPRLLSEVPGSIHGATLVASGSDSPRRTPVGYVGPTFAFSTPGPGIYAGFETALPTTRIADGFTPSFEFDLTRNPSLNAFGGPNEYWSWPVAAHTYAIPYTTGDAGVDAYSGAQIYADPCHPSLGFVSLDSSATAEQVVQAIPEVRGFTVDPPRPVTIDGHRGLAVEFRYTAFGDALDCDDPGLLRVLQADPGIDEEYAIDFSPGSGYSTGCCGLDSRHMAQLGQGIATRWFVIDVDDRPVIFEAWSTFLTGGSLFERLDDLEAIVTHMTFR